jgi:hypothetical protein
MWVMMVLISICVFEKMDKWLREIELYFLKGKSKGTMYSFMLFVRKDVTKGCIYKEKISNLFI